jgi:hypothetical protein
MGECMVRGELGGRKGGELQPRHVRDPGYIDPASQSVVRCYGINLYLEHIERPAMHVEGERPRYLLYVFPATQANFCNDG